MKKWMSLLLVVLLVLSMGSAAWAEGETTDPLGAVENNVYTNEAFGFRMVLPDNWAFLSDGEMASLLGYGAGYGSREGLSTLLKTQFNVCAMYMKATDDPSATANFMVEDLRTYQYLDEKGYLSLAKDGLIRTLQMQGLSNVQLTEQTWQLSSREYVGAVVTGSVGSGQIYMVDVIIKTGQYMGTLTISSTSQKKTEEALAFFEPLAGAEKAQSAAGGQQPYENEKLDMAAEFDEGWYVFNEAERAQQLGLATGTVSDEDLAKIMTDALESGKSIMDLSVQRLDGNGDNINLILTSMGALGIMVDEKTYYTMGKAQLEQYFRQLGATDLSLTEEEVTFCGKTHFSVFIRASVNAQTFYERQIYIKAGTYIGVLTFFSKDEARLGPMADLFHPCAAETNG